MSSHDISTPASAIRHYPCLRACPKLDPMDTRTPYSAATSTSVRTGSIAWLKRRWPAALALVASAIIGSGSESPGGVAGLAHVLSLLPLIYLAMAKLGKRQATWPGLAIGVATVFGLRILDVIPPAAAFTGIALVILVWAGVDGQLRRDGTFRLQALGMLFFGALALAGLLLDPEMGRYLVAAGWFLHGVWDFVHLKQDKVVARTFAEWCGVLDVMIAAQLVFQP
ncbi:hypothetical protein ACIBG4_37505 [Nonomuraea sp. NPDC050383]|uniref:hypothetical protein n=1 Tax=Nonomuraea sp. NPDC050383 TaxID=3364362 RepID=UPI0037A7EA66